MHIAFTSLTETDEKLRKRLLYVGVRSAKDCAGKDLDDLAWTVSLRRRRDYELIFE